AAPLTVPPLLVNIVEVPAVALLVKTISPNSPFAPTVVMKCCVLPELFVMPVPLILSVKGALAVMVYGFVAAAVKVMPLTSVFAEIETLVVFDRANVAMSAGPLGTPIGVQLAAVFQSPEVGLRFHCALSA